MGKHTKHFSQKSFTFFTINFIVGLGFLTTLATVANFGFYGYLIILLAAIVVFGISLVFSRLANNFKEHYGGSYQFARHLDDKITTGTIHDKVEFNNIKERISHHKYRLLSFFIGWNQFLQSPILSSIAPLFIADTNFNIGFKK
ncbi:hypothetical protein ACJA23_01085 [Mycoplasma corogypsi]|uniref:hypothetical protein n=1 Tax=Mycoplasma corogypsi TaxID=2106 RepID=UPI003872D9B5